MKYASVIEQFTKNFFRQFQEPIWQTKSKEVAIRIARELGPDYTMSWTGNYFAFHIKMEQGHIEDFNKALEELKADRISHLVNFFEKDDFDHRKDNRIICKTIEKIVEDIEAEKHQAIVERIDFEEETRSKYRRY